MVRVWCQSKDYALSLMDKENRLQDRLVIRLSFFEQLSKSWSPLFWLVPKISTELCSPYLCTVETRTKLGAEARLLALESRAERMGEQLETRRCLLSGVAWLFKACNPQSWVSELEM
ncbi:hypothetical protein RRG08_032210 [Elysia crispata]|uniref:Uncharacterized protein n=1 Tax=Elysia crispata TaxID=231223 RepID=A0AAE1DVZ4_9GAST|nr:hypothetical protein RRG08_032210 [Elysia crispata]